MEKHKKTMQQIGYPALYIGFYPVFFEGDFGQICHLFTLSDAGSIQRFLSSRKRCFVMASFLILLNLLPPEQEGLRVEEGQAQLRVGGQQVQVAAGGADGEADLDGDELRALHQAQRQHGG